RHPTPSRRRPIWRQRRQPATSGLRTTVHPKADKHTEAIVKRVSRRHDDEGHGGAWKVAFADFCLALMCLFLVMWVLAARNQERAEEVMRAVGGRAVDEGQGVMPETMGGPRGSLI